MIFKETLIEGAYVIEREELHDIRGYFARSYCVNEFRDHGLHTNWVQCNVSYNIAKGTLRGLHYQGAPFGEPKLVQCTGGSIHDVIVDLRPDSPTYLDQFAIKLAQSDQGMLYVPAGCAHGFQTLEDHTSVFYQMGEFFHPECAFGIRYNDPALAIHWPLDVSVISDKDASYADFRPAA